ncbi:hypothetical protein SAMN02745947_02229 [Rhodococcus rhodochrous J3]|uniref:Secreted protein n=2 Tax=Rhodococcus rhodochrous TaxID=1829 RepID=A0AA47ABT2_RHORH|nr:MULTISPECIES: hypothetical protein [Rhodococcus]AYA25437.1 hypothetical protein C6369_013745 [Rhodococcus rhodochrous]MBF4479780.1 hypothetical protein [Rhodococcus rhodochrous]MCB8912898.1 hypothetical protein [Rhodococcus rhodochrous]MCD2096627.1 hypothetical protein [Rhodococcus rhodochrous]MCD2121155.1 hypothetical protein [Rhodococcus rhodochrous]
MTRSVRNAVAVCVVAAAATLGTAGVASAEPAPPRVCSLGDLVLRSLNLVDCVNPPTGSAGVATGSADSAGSSTGSSGLGITGYGAMIG